MIEIEIEVNSADAKNEIYDLRNYLQQNIDGLQLHIKEQSPQEGQMVISPLVECILKGAIEAGVAVSLEMMYHKTIQPYVSKWFIARKNSGKAPTEIISTLRNEGSKIHFIEDSAGRSKIFDNARYAIDTDRTRALLIGVSEFENEFPPIPPVKGNIEDVYQLLIDKRHIGLPTENVTVSFNENHKEILKRLAAVSKIPDTETLIIYFAGHGYRSDIKKLYLVAKDTDKLDDDILGGIDFDFIKEKVIRNSPARQKILVLDACHSGIATQGNNDLTMGMDVKGSYTITSSAGDEVSYFDKNGRNTHFTSTLIEVLKNGIDNTNEMLALEDLYDYSRKKLSEKKYPQPIVKSELNIPASSFYIAPNPLFSPEKLKQKAQTLFNQRRLEEALTEYRLLLKKFPEDARLRAEFEQCETDLFFSRLVEQANRCFYQKQDYSKAIELYDKAYRLKKDQAVFDKIHECRNLMEQDFSESGAEQMQKAKEEKESTNKLSGIDHGKKNETFDAARKKSEKKKEQQKKIRKKFFIGALSTALAAIIWLKLVQPAIDEKKAILGKIYYDKGMAFYNKNEYSKAFIEFEKAIENASTLAKVQLGYMYSRGLGTLINKEKARELYQEAAEEEDGIGMNNLASFYLSGEGGLPKDCSKAFELLIKSKKITDTIGLVFANLGYIYEFGCGSKVIQDKNKAIENYKRGALLGDSYSKEQLKKLKVDGY